MSASQTQDIRMADRYDVIVAGARCAGASTAMLLARSGARVLVVDPTRRGSDTLSTHALMRGGVLQLARWGLLEKIVRAGTPPIRTTTFHYEDEAVPIAIKARDGVDALYAPRRTLLDRVLVDAAEEAGAHVVHGMAVAGVLRDASGRVIGATVAGPDGREMDLRAELVVGADGMRSRVARLVAAPVQHMGHHEAACILGYWSGLDVDGYHWHYRPGVGAGVIPTNGGDTCIFSGMPALRFARERWRGLEWLYGQTLLEAAPGLAVHMEERTSLPKLRAFAGAPGFLRRCVGPGWALVGDAGYFRDPFTAHGITDALRDAELLARAIVAGGERDLEEYAATRDRVARELMHVTDRLASFAWDMQEVRDLHFALSRSMAAGVDVARKLDETGTMAAAVG
jgi:flavin-dependent dehydrogenase